MKPSITASLFYISSLAKSFFPLILSVRSLHGGENYVCKRMEAFYRFFD